MHLLAWINCHPAVYRWRVVAALIAVTLLAACGGNSATPAPTTAPTAAAPVAVVAVERAMVFPAPDRNAEPFTSLYERERIPVEGASPDGSFLRVSIDGQPGWILRAQVEIEGDLALVAVAEATEAASDVPAMPTATAVPTETPTLAIVWTNTPEPVTLTPTPGVTVIWTDTPSAIAAAPTITRPTRTPLPTRTPGGVATATELPVKLGAPPPLSITLPDGWQAADMLVPFSSYGEARELPLTIYAGPLAEDVRGIIYLFWDFPNVVSASGELNLWADGVQLLRGSLIGDACNLGVYDQKTLTVGGQSGVGAFYQADECEGQANAAGWFVTVRVGSTSFAFFVAVEPLEAMPDQVMAMQAILDTVRFNGLP